MQKKILQTLRALLFVVGSQMKKKPNLTKSGQFSISIGQSHEQSYEDEGIGDHDRSYVYEHKKKKAKKKKEKAKI